ESNFIVGRFERRDGRGYLVTDDGWQIAIQISEDVSPGERVTIALRPERIVLGEERGDNRTLATIEEIIYVGEATKFRVRVTGDRVLSIKQPSRSETMRFRRGDRVPISWRAEDAVVLRARK
ncbi:MAG: TOBE domain-containing protein, partial [Thermomicrobium sp.]|nr:TOBE domain-containing protein [Thermomicrobium sp.]